jgi:hypothetical protein
MRGAVAAPECSCISGFFRSPQGETVYLKMKRKLRLGTCDITDVLTEPARSLD